MIERVADDFVLKHSGMPSGGQPVHSFVAPRCLVDRLHRTRIASPGHGCCNLCPKIGERPQTPSERSTLDSSSRPPPFWRYKFWALDL